jgi:hypothetical protein
MKKGFIEQNCLQKMIYASFCGNLFTWVEE